ncbi:arylamine N-acetyltransferase [Cardiobacteriaceae bacterium TAE3-ERU3]|nr:arylamine N-acetyltransferase [Cardiobacteriaceae bacterium TAE3-ERU3]
MDIQKYIERIGLDHTPDISIQSLRLLQTQHLFFIPFENLDIHSNTPINLDESVLFEKIVTRKRGGYCYELNGLFYSLLDALGYEVCRVSAQVHQQGETFGEPCDHMALLVSLDGCDWLVDVGFGSFARYPLQLESEEIQADPHGNYQITPHRGLYLVSEDGNPTYLLDPTPRKLAEFAAMNRYHQTSPKSFFTSQRMISRPTEHGRITLTDQVLRIRENGKIEETSLSDPIQFERMYTKYFNTL